ncbi:MAG: TIGR03619 family F420-dependent LLM class oxidoreductase [Deltaproteobacteria bacterium]|nr:TIGR03619 family F420-dependent LLM class oxidoreductase [Deltaproteobacteria bacterium]
MTIRTAVGLYGLENVLGGDFRRVTEIVKRADAEGIGQVVMTDHVVMGTRTDRYPYGPFPSPPEYPWFEPIVAMSVFAGVTTRVRLSMSVLIAPLRPAVLLAKQAATLDLLSNGRLDLGVGTGWQREEYDASGIPFEGRGVRLAEQMRACRDLWTNAPGTYQGETVDVRGLYSKPFPVQPGGPPLWFGLAPTEINCKRIAELGVGWIPIVQDPAAIAEGVKSLRAAFSRAGRDPSELQVRAHVPPRPNTAARLDLEATLAAGLEPALAAGVTVIEILPFLFARNESEINAVVERVARLGR